MRAKSHVVLAMSSVAADLEIRLSLTQWEKFVKHLLFLRDKYQSSEVKITDQFIDIRRASPVPRPIISRIYFRIQEGEVVVYRALLFSLIRSEIYGTSDELKEDIHLLLSDFLK